MMRQSGFYKAVWYVNVFFLVACFSFAAHSQGQSGGSYDLSWSTIDNGGGEIGSGVYMLTGTIGQSDTTIISGGDYDLIGGFWPGEPLCIVDFYHYARFAEYWLESGSDLPADLYEDDTVDLFDLKLFVDEWLYYCPYDWPLR